MAKLQPGLSALVENLRVTDCKWKAEKLPKKLTVKYFL